MEKKYELLKDDTMIMDDGTKLYRIRALKDFDIVRKGELGGYIEKEDNLSHMGNCWVYNKARVYGDAVVCANAKVCNNARVYGNALVSDNAVILDSVRVHGGAIVRDNARVWSRAKVCDNAILFNYASVLYH